MYLNTIHRKMQLTTETELSINWLLFIRTSCLQRVQLHNTKKGKNSLNIFPALQIWEIPSRMTYNKMSPHPFNLVGHSDLQQGGEIGQPGTKAVTQDGQLG